MAKFAFQHRIFWISGSSSTMSGSIMLRECLLEAKDYIAMAIAVTSGKNLNDKSQYEQKSMHCKTLLNHTKIFYNWRRKNITDLIQPLLLCNNIYSCLYHLTTITITYNMIKNNFIYSFWWFKMHMNGIKKRQRDD